ncbi:DUF7313 family protein [Haloarchaeobius sp. DFWS5]|uniref:DUF7313 family protein n=1 Tax=Haloarchaeobius sp. DFWS5 TaxID=3446114 RepID=UPI003EBA87D5
MELAVNTAVNIFGPLDALQAEVFGGTLLIEYVLLVLVIINMGTRFLSYRNAVKTAENDGDLERLSRYMPHEVTNVLLVLAAFYYTTVDPHGGLVFAMLAVGMVLTDFFEAEVRDVDVRKDAKPRAPKGALTASAMLIAYILFQSVFFVVKDLWTAVI